LLFPPLPLSRKHSFDSESIYPLPRKALSFTAVSFRPPCMRMMEATLLFFHRGPFPPLFVLRSIFFPLIRTGVPPLTEKGFSLPPFSLILTVPPLISRQCRPLFLSSLPFSLKSFSGSPFQADYGAACPPSLNFEDQPPPLPL